MKALRNFSSQLVLSGLCFCWVISFFSCGPGTLSKAEETAIQAEIRQTILGYCRDVKKHGLTAEFRYLDSTADFKWRPPGYAHAIDFDSVATILRKNAGSVKSISNVYDSLRVEPIDKEHASYSALVRSTVTDARGQVSRMLLSESGFVVKRSDGWKLHSGETKIYHH